MWTKITKRIVMMSKLIFKCIYAYARAIFEYNFSGDENRPIFLEYKLIDFEIVLYKSKRIVLGEGEGEYRDEIPSPIFLWYDKAFPQ